MNPDPDDPPPSRPVHGEAAEKRRGLLDLARARAAGRRMARLRRALASIFIATAAPAAALGWSGLGTSSPGVPVPVLVLGVTASTVAPLVIWALCREWQNDRRTEEILTLVELHPDEGQASASRAAT